MFRPGYFLQIITALVFLSGCASTHSGTGAQVNNISNSTAEKSTAVNKQIDSSRTYPNNIFGDFVDSDKNLFPELHIFAIETAQKHNLDLNNLEILLKSAKYEQTAARLMTPPPNKRRIKRAWASYKKRHVDPIRTKRGTAFWQEHKTKLDKISQQTGVPQSIIVAIIGIETVYGQYMGNHRVLDSLTTLGFRYPDPNRPERQAMFRSQLADLLLLHEMGKIDANTVNGSYAGAMGLSQFMPTSLLNYAVDGNGDGHIDLHNSRYDAIASVASFLLAHGWVPNQPVFAPVTLSANAIKLQQHGLEPETNWQQLQNAGATANDSHKYNATWQDQELGVIDLRDEIRDTHEYRVATANFFAITKYNRSYFYASSVADLANEIAKNMGYGYPY